MILVIICFGIIVVYGAYLTWDEYRFESLTPGLGEPQWLHTGWLPLLSLFVIGRAAGRAFACGGEKPRDRDLPVRSPSW